MLLAVLLIFAVVCSSTNNEEILSRGDTVLIRARAHIFRASRISPPTTRIGTVRFRQRGDVVKITGIIFGLKEGLHGFHVHEKGDLGNNCIAAGPHFNPLNMTHGAPNGTIRHVGDLGNINSTKSRITWINITDSAISLNILSTRSVIGRAIVVHEMPDDLGRGNSSQSNTTGNAGARVACGVIIPISSPAFHSPRFSSMSYYIDWISLAFTKHLQLW